VFEAETINHKGHEGTQRNGTPESVVEADFARTTQIGRWPWQQLPLSQREGLCFRGTPRSIPRLGTAWILPPSTRLRGRHRELLHRRWSDLEEHRSTSPRSRFRREECAKLPIDLRHPSISRAGRFPAETLDAIVPLPVRPSVAIARHAYQRPPRDELRFAAQSPG